MKHDEYTLLLVDDNTTNLDVLSDLLLNKGYEILVSIDGASAIERARLTQPHLILLDIMMPGIDGFETCKRLKADPATAEIPVIFMTALGDTQNKVRGFSSGAVDYITKPFEADEVLARVSNHLLIQQLQKDLKEKNALLSDRAKHLESEVHKRTLLLKDALKLLKSASLDTILRLTMAAEYKDKDTGQHTRRIGHLSGATAKLLNLSDKEVETILNAAPMHDIGKIGIPDAILLKPGKLDKDEWDIMRQHTTIGAKILAGSDVDFINLAHTVAMTHHEKWDGSGYPTGLSGNDIPIIGRIVAIVDVFDALLSRRPYKEPFSLEMTLAILEEGRGNHFDPDIVDLFLANIDELLAIRQKYTDTTD